MSRRDHYEVLGVSRSASTGDIRRAFRGLALRYHPDVNPGVDAAWRFREVADAYDVLQDPAQRARYDAASRPARDVEARAMPWTIARRPHDAPRFVDEGGALGGDDLMSALLRAMLQPDGATAAWTRSGEGWPKTGFRTTEVWRWH